MKFIKSKSKLEDNKYNDLFLKIYTSYKNVIKRKLDCCNKIIETVKEEVDEEEEGDKIEYMAKNIQGRTRSRGIGFSNNKIFTKLF